MISGVIPVNMGSPSSVTVGTSSTLICNANLRRRFLCIVNNGDNPVYLAFGTAAQMNKGIRLNANGGSIMLTPMCITTEAVYGIASANTDVVFIEGG